MYENSLSQIKREKVFQPRANLSYVFKFYK